jgi:hypothetical protein
LLATVAGFGTGRRSLDFAFFEGLLADFFADFLAAFFAAAGLFKAFFDAFPAFFAARLPVFARVFEAAAVTLRALFAIRFLDFFFLAVATTNSFVT